MNYKKLSIWSYIAVLVACIYSCTDYMVNAAPSEYTKTISQIKYQLAYSEVYSGVASFDKVQDVVTTDKKDDEETEEKVIYLTFDDGPSPRTLEILDILKEYDIPATFFIVLSKKDSDKEIIKRAYDEGHSIGVHSASHTYNKIYKSVTSYLEDFEICFNYINEITGSTPTIFRFPGGSVNNFNSSVRHELTQEMTRRGFAYFDWNVTGGDAEKSHSQQSIYKNIVGGCKKHTESVVLLHDSIGKKDTVAALKQALPELISQGYTFKSLDESVKPVIFKIK